MGKTLPPTRKNVFRMLKYDLERGNIVDLVYRKTPRHRLFLKHMVGGNFFFFVEMGSLKKEISFER